MLFPIAYGIVNVMKIEKISENQIRCTLTKEDLTSRQIRLSELAYGSDKAKQLFHDMMQEAEYTVGFTSDNAPLMIEAIPTSIDSIVLVITKVDDPEELDTRFSRFTRSGEDAEEAGAPSFAGADEVLDLFHKIYEAKKAESPAPVCPKQKERQPSISTPASETPDILVQAFRFRSLSDLIRAAQSLRGIVLGANAVYADRQKGMPYLLVLHPAGNTPEAFNKLCNILSEYGKNEPFDSVREAYLAEHQTPLLKERALQTLAEIQS